MKTGYYKELRKREEVTQLSKDLLNHFSKSFNSWYFLGGSIKTYFYSLGLSISIELVVRNWTPLRFEIGQIPYFTMKIDLVFFHFPT